MSDQAMGVVLLLAAVLLWMLGSFLQLHIIRRLEKLIDRMRRMPVSLVRPARRGRRRRDAAASPAPEDRLSVGSPQR
jgi:hypothetical protein